MFIGAEEEPKRPEPKMWVVFYKIIYGDKIPGNEGGGWKYRQVRVSERIEVPTSNIDEAIWLARKKAQLSHSDASTYEIYDETGLICVGNDQ
jgi:hypothetical protein